MNTDLEFALKCSSGDRQAWDEFLVKYSRLIYTYIFSSAKTCGATLTPSEKEDIFQEIVLSLVDNNFRKLKSYRAANGCSLASWLRQVTINFALNRLSLARPPLSLEMENPSGLALKEMIADTGKAAPEISVEKETRGRLTECIERLGLEDKYFLELNLNLGLKLEEIREHLQITRGAADMRKARIIERLRDCFKVKGLII